MPSGKFKDLLGEKFPGDWVVVALHSVGKGSTLWSARHKCGNVQHLRASQLRSGRPSLCARCGSYNNRVRAAKVASDTAAVKSVQRPSGGKTLLATIAEMRRRVGEIRGEGLAEGKKEEKFVRVTKKMTPFEIGLEQAREYSRYNFVR